MSPPVWEVMEGMGLNDAMKEASRTKLLRQKHNESTARWRAKLTEEKKEAIRKANRDSHRKQHAQLSEMERDVIRASDRRRKKRAHKKSIDGHKKKKATAHVSPLEKTYWWQQWPTFDPEKTGTIEKAYSSSQCLSIEKCTKCGKIFWDVEDCKAHVFGLVGNLGSNEKPRKVLG